MKTGRTNLRSLCVVEDFHFESLKNNINALSLVMGKNTGMVSFKFNPERTKEVISEIESTWKEIASNQPFQYSFMDDDFATLYAQEQNTGELLAIFTGLAILIACLGLFALSAFTTEQRTKEIGIRKGTGSNCFQHRFAAIKGIQPPCRNCICHFVTDRVVRHFFVVTKL